MSKASGGDGIPVEPFQNLKDDSVKVLHSICQQIWKTQQWPQDWRSVSIPIPNKSSARECSNYWTIAFISHASKVMFKILQASFQQYMKWELPYVQGEIIKGRGTRGQVANICWITKKAREFQINIYFCFLDYSKAFDCVDHNKLRKILKDMGIADHLICSWKTSMQVKKQQLGLDRKQWTGSTLGKKYVKTVYRHPAYLTYRQSTSWEIVD